MVGSAISLFVSLLILFVSGVTLYLSHIKEYRSDVHLLSYESSTTRNSFASGNNAEDSSAMWSGSTSLKVTNTGKMGAHVSSITDELRGLKVDGEVVAPDNVSLEKGRSSPSLAGTEIEAGRTTQYRPNFRISPKKDVNTLIAHDVAVIDHTLAVEDNKGAYEVEHTTEMALTGPRFFRDN